MFDLSHSVFADVIKSARIDVYDLSITKHVINWYAFVNDHASIISSILFIKFKSSEFFIL